MLAKHFGRAAGHAAAVAAATLIAFMGPANATTVTNSYDISALSAGGASQTSSGPLIDSWSQGDLSANVSVITGSGTSSQYASATGDSATPVYASTTGTWTDTYLVSGPTNGALGSIDVFDSLASSANGTPATDDVQVNFSILADDLTSGQTHQQISSWNPCTPSFICGSSDVQSIDTSISIANGDTIQLSGSLWQHLDAQQGGTGSNTYSFSSTSDVTSIELSSGYTLTPVPLPATVWLLISGLGAIGAMARRRKAA